MEKRLLQQHKRCKRIKLFALFKFVTFVLFVGGFSSQVFDFLTQFYTYPTVMNIDIERPKEFIQPAITLCTNNMVIRSKFCERFPSKCRRPKDMRLFCQQRPNYCIKRNMSNFAIPDSIDLWKHYVSRTREEIKLLSPKLQNFILGEDSSKRRSFKGPFYVFSDINSFGRVKVPCFTYNSCAVSNETPIKYPFNQFLSKHIIKPNIKLNLESDEIAEKDALPLAYLSIHSPFNMYSPEDISISLEAGKIYKIYVNFEKEIFLPRPYKTDCIDYEEMWRKNNRTGPRSQLICADMCREEYFWKCYNCSEATWETEDRKCLANRKRVCNSTENAKSKRKIVSCKEKCKIACTQYKFPFKFQGILPHNQWLIENGRSFIEINIFMENPEILVFQHTPKYVMSSIYFICSIQYTTIYGNCTTYFLVVDDNSPERDVELFSNIGGLLGCWLGISIWSSSLALFKIPSMILRILLNKMRTTTNSL